MFNPENFLYFYKFFPGRVIDGDTFTIASIDLGFYTKAFHSNIDQQQKRVRLYGIDCYEKRKSTSATKKYKERGIYKDNYDILGAKATDYVNNVFRGSDGFIISVHRNQKIDDNFGRILGIVYTRDVSTKEWTCLNDRLIGAGYAFDWEEM